MNDIVVLSPPQINLFFLPLGKILVFNILCCVIYMLIWTTVLQHSSINIFLSTEVNIEYGSNFILGQIIREVLSID